MKKHVLYLFRFIPTVVLICAISSCGMDVGDDDAKRATGDFNDDASGEGMDSSSGADADADADAPADEGDDDGFPPEVEETANYMAPKGSGQYVFIADESHDAVVVVDSETLEIKVIDVGSRPTHLVPLSQQEDGRVALINLDSDEVTLLEMDEAGDIAMLDLPVRPDTNALVPSPDGRYVIAFHDPKFTAKSGPPTTDQEISVLTVEKGKESSVHMTIGMHPWQVVYNESITRAFVVTEEGINIIDLEKLGTIGIPPIVSPFEGGTYDPVTADIEIMPDGSLALARKTESNTLVAAWLDGSDEMRTYELGAVPTDLDIAEDGTFGTLVLRSLNKVAFFDLPLPVDPEEDPFTLIDLGDKIAGVATIMPDGNHVLLHTTTAGEVEDKKRLTLLAYSSDTWHASSIVLERQILAVAAGVMSRTAVVIHQKVNAGPSDKPYSYSLVTIPKLQIKFQQIPVEPGQLLLTSDGDFGFLLLEQANRTDIIDLNSFIVDELKLGSPPTAAGYAALTDKIFIAQNHPAGRMTFVGVHDDSVKTVTGYNLNDEIEY